MRLVHRGPGQPFANIPSTRHYGRTMTLAKMITAAVAGCAAMLVLTAPSASAATKVVHDPRGDAMAGFDLTRTTFHNAPRRISVKARVAGLRFEATGVALIFTPVRHPDLSIAARTFLDRDGTRKTRQQLYVTPVPDGPTYRIPCAVRAGWHVDLDYVRVSVPQSCLRRNTKMLAMSAAVFKPGTDIVYDQTRWTAVQRGTGPDALV